MTDADIDRLYERCNVHTFLPGSDDESCLYCQVRTIILHLVSLQAQVRELQEQLNECPNYRARYGRHLYGCKESPPTPTPWQLHREGKCSGVPSCLICVIVAARQES